MVEKLILWATQEGEHTLQSILSAKIDTLNEHWGEMIKF